MGTTIKGSCLAAAPWWVGGGLGGGTEKLIFRTEALRSCEQEDRCCLAKALLQTSPTPTPSLYPG